MSGNSVQLLGARLLQGWCMLGVSCGKCNVPLMEDKRNNKIECVSCNSIFQRQDDVFGISTIVRCPEEEEDKQDTGSENKNENNSIESNTNEEQNATPETPQLGDQGEDENEDYDLHKKDPVEQQKRDQYIKNMGEKLLMGWALLGEECPNCNTPLMRDKNNSMWCLRCDMRVVREEEFNPRVHFDVKQQNQQTNTNTTNNTNNSSIVNNNTNNQNTNNNTNTPNTTTNNTNINTNTITQSNSLINTNNTNTNNTNNNSVQPTPTQTNKNEIPSQSLDEKSPLLSKELSSIHDRIIFPHQKLPSDHPLIINASTFPDKKIPKKSSQSVKKKKNKTTTTTTPSNLVKQPNLTNIIPLNNNNTNNNTNNNPFEDNSDSSSPRTLGSPSFTSLQIVHETKWRAINAINQKLAVATQLLESTTDLQQSSALLRFITECSHSLEALLKL